MTSEDFDYDEDIILPNSPLSEYLHNFEELENKEIESKYISNSRPSQTFFPTTNTLSCLLPILNCIKYILNKIFHLFVPSLTAFEYISLKSVLKSYSLHKVVISEDLSGLMNFESEDEIKRDYISYTYLCLKCFNLFGLLIAYMYIKSSFVIIDIDYDFFIPYNTQLGILNWLLSLIFYIIFFGTVTFTLINLIELFACKLLLNSVKTKLHDTEKTTTILKRSLRLIQEAELIARGFTFASVLGVVERLELSKSLPIISPERQYPELRKNIYRWLRERFMLYRNATRKLITNIIINPDLDFSSQSMAVLDIKEFGHLLSFDVNSDSNLEELLKNTDGLSVSCLKTMSHLVELQISEFYKYLYIKTSLLISYYVYNFFRKINVFHYLIIYVKSLANEETQLKEKAYDVYRFYKSFEVHTTCNDNTLKSKSDAGSLQNSIHNMTLHLKAALKRLIDIEELFENEKEDYLKNDNFLKYIENRIIEIASEIDAYNEYYHGCCDMLQAALYGKKHSNESISPEEMPTPKENQKLPIVTKCDKDILVEDEIFEAVVTKTLLENEDECESYSVKERKQNTEVTGRLMHELKNVLLVKADEHRIREEKALAKKLHKQEILPEGLESQKHDLSNINNPDLDSDLTPTKVLIPDITMINSSPRNSEIAENRACSNFCVTELQNSLENKSSSFAASIAALALQRQKKLGVSSDICFSSGEDSDDEIIG